MKFIDRTTEQENIKKIIKAIKEGQETCIWIEGVGGAGKSYFLKYMKTKFIDLPVFNYNEHEWLYKCDENGIENEYQLFTEIISCFQKKYPSKLNEFLVKYFEKIYDISWVEALANIIPTIKLTKWAKDIIDISMSQIEHSKQDISNRLYTSGLKTCLAEIVYYFLTDVQHREQIVFCIDDACWLDEYSIETLNIFLNMVKYKNSNLKVSLIVLTRPKKELISSNKNYNRLERVLNDIYENDVKYIKIKNFDYKSTMEYIQIMEKNYSQEITHNIYRVTNGNPNELFQTLKFKDDDLEGVIPSDTCAVTKNFMSMEYILQLAKNNNYTLPIICSISLLNQKMQHSWLLNIIKNYCKDIFKEPFNPLKFDECIQILKQQKIIEENSDYISVVHDSLKEITIEYIKNNGEYYEYMDSLTNSIFKEWIIDNSTIRELMYLFSEYSPIKCFELFTHYLKSNSYLLDGSIIRLVGKSLTLEMSLYSAENISKYIVPVILERCIQLSYYSLGYKLCSIIYNYRTIMPQEILFRYYIDFLKILIDQGELTPNKKYNVSDIIEKIFTLPQLSLNQRLESYVIAMSAYEHLLDFENIKKYNRLATALVEDENTKVLYRVMYLRNQGLVKSHCDLKEEYTQALQLAANIENKYERYLMLGTCYNNLGLYYLYSSDVLKALECFEQARGFLSEIGYDIFRVLNNIGVCYILLGENEKAYDSILQAKVLNTDCVFEKLCIQSNLAIIEYKQKEFDVAKKMLTQIIDDYKKQTKLTSDDLVYSSAMVNRAYFYFLEKDYVMASKLYKESMFFDYRYNDELQKKKRNDMLKLSMYELGIADMPTHNIDIMDNKFNIFNKMYALIAFAYYII